LFLARHGQTSFNEERRFTGWADPPLTALGISQAKALGRRIRDERIDAVYSSDLRRAVETANIATQYSRARPVEITIDSSLREANFGSWQGLTFAEASARDPGAADALIRRSIDFCAPGGETIPEVHERLNRFLSRLREGADNVTILVVASGGPLQILVASLFGMPVESHWRLAIDNCSLSIVNFVQDEPCLALLNDRSHLLGMRRSRTAARAATSDEG
jgi:broad specificity phosphatase PhoE